MIRLPAGPSSGVTQIRERSQSMISVPHQQRFLVIDIDETEQSHIPIPSPNLTQAPPLNGIEHLDQPIQNRIQRLIRSRANFVRVKKSFQRPNTPGFPRQEITLPDRITQVSAHSLVECFDGMAGIMLFQHYCHSGSIRPGRECLHQEMPLGRAKLAAKRIPTLIQIHGENSLALEDMIQQPPIQLESFHLLCVSPERLRPARECLWPEIHALRQ